MSKQIRWRLVSYGSSDDFFFCLYIGRVTVWRSADNTGGPAMGRNFGVNVGETTCEALGPAELFMPCDGRKPRKVLVGLTDHRTSQILRDSALAFKILTELILWMYHEHFERH